MGQKTKLSHQVSWDPRQYVGYSNEQLELIRVGFTRALNEIYRLEERTEQEDKNE